MSVSIPMNTTEIILIVCVDYTIIKFQQVVLNALTFKQQILFVSWQLVTVYFTEWSPDGVAVLTQSKLAIYCK